MVQQIRKWSDTQCGVASHPLWLCIKTVFHNHNQLLCFIWIGPNHLLKLFYFILSLWFLCFVKSKHQNTWHPIPSATAKKLSVHFAFIKNSMFGHHRVIALTTERNCHSVTVSGGSGTGRHLAPQTKPKRAVLRLALTPLCSNVIGWDRIVIDLDRSVIGPGSAVTHKVSQGESPHPLTEEAAWLTWNMPLKTSVSLHSC